MASLPKKIGKYDIACLLGEGAMGVVYEGFDPDIERRVAIKILHPHMINQRNGVEFLERFKREAISAARCTHPNVVTVLEYGLDGDTPYIVMEFVEGYTLQEIIRRGRPVKLQNSLSIISQLLKALHSAHKLKIVHRDIKTANVMILKDGGNVKLADFGIARIVESPDLTMTGAVVGTPRFMAPEQMFGLKVDSRADLFSVAMVFMDLLALLPKNSAIPSSSFPEIVNMPPNNRIDYTILYPSALIPVLSKGLAVSQQQRYQTARDFVQAIKAALPQLKPTASASSEDATAIVQKSSQPHSASKDELDTMTRLLVDYVGPIAKNIMSAHEADSTSAIELASAISKEIPTPEEREAFLKRWHSISGTRIAATNAALGLSGMAVGKSTTVVFEDDMLQKIGADYAAYIGPLAERLVKHYSASSTDLEQLVNALAAEIPDVGDSQRFKNSWI